MAGTQPGGGLPPERAPRRPFPALDPEPPPLPWWRRLLLPAAVLLLAGAVSAAVRLWPSAAPGSPAAGAQRGRAAGPPVQAGGHILAVTARGTLVLATPAGRQVRPVHGVGDVGDSVASSPDGRYLSLLNGQLISIRPGPVLQTYPAKVPLSSSTTVALPYPFADHDRAVVMMRDYGDPAQSAANPISVVSVTTGHSVSLGTGDVVAADPQAPGVFTAVAAPAQVGGSVLASTPDAAVVLRDAGRPAVRLATAATLNRALGQPGREPVSLAPCPSPAGSAVAVTVRPASGGPVRGIVILSRKGRVLGHTALAAPGPQALGAQGIPAWSPSGRSLAYLRIGNRVELDIWRPGGSTTSDRLPAAGGSYGQCLWSPDEQSVLCPLRGAAGGSTWVVASAQGGRTATAHGAGLPVTWLR